VELLLPYIIQAVRRITIAQVIENVFGHVVLPNDTLRNRIIVTGTVKSKWLVRQSQSRYTGSSC
jgi:hypothetical protein